MRASLTWSEYKAQLTAKLSDRAHLERCYDSIAAVFAGDRAWSPAVVKVATLARDAVAAGRMSRADAAAEITRAFIDGHEVWREQNPTLAAEMDRLAIARTRDAQKKKSAPRDPAAKRAEDANAARIARLSSKATTPAPTRTRADAAPVFAPTPIAPPPPPAKPALSAYHAARMVQLGASEADYRRTIGPLALHDPGEALTPEARAHCQARGLSPSIFAERAFAYGPDRRRYLTPDYH